MVAKSFALDNWPHRQYWLQEKERALRLPFMQGGLTAINVSCAYDFEIGVGEARSIAVVGYGISEFIERARRLAKRVIAVCDIEYITREIECKMDCEVFLGLSAAPVVEWVALIDPLDFWHASRYNELRYTLDWAREKATIGVVVACKNFNRDWMQSTLMSKFARVELQGRLLIARKDDPRDLLGL